MSSDVSDTMTPAEVTASPASAIIALLSCLGLALGIAYGWKDGLHGEISPQTASILYLPAVWLAARQPLVQHPLHRFALAAAACCFGLGWYVYLAGIRMGYMDWLMTGCVAKNAHSHSLLLGYLGGSVLACILAVRWPFKSSPLLQPC